MPTSDIIAFLSLIIALSAYIATIRLRLIDKIKTADEDKKKEYKRACKTLTLADAPLIISGAFLFFHGFWTSFCSSPVPSWLLPGSVYLFTFAGMTLIIHHIAAWYKSVTA